MAQYHIITCEYPPQPGGVSDYTRVVAEGLAAAGDEVHVWCPNVEGGDVAPLSSQNLGVVEPPHSKVFVHREMGAFTPQDLHAVSRRLEKFSAPRRVLVQWVPHGYGFHSMNLAFCLWLWGRALRGDEVELMVHEPSLGFGEGSWKHNIVAAVHRLMTIILLRTTRRVWVSIPAWEKRWRPYTLGRATEFRWLPVGSNIPVVESSGVTRKIRARYAETEALIGHFGAYDASTRSLLLQSLPELMKENARLLLLGHGSRQMRAALVVQNPGLSDRIHATGSMNAVELSQHISACDVMLQPYIDGISSRRTSAMTALAHGVPVVTTKGKLTESLWADSKGLALVPVEQTGALTDETRRLLNDRTRRENMGTAAREFYVQHFDNAATIAKLRSAYA